MQEKKLKANGAYATRKQKPVTRHPLKKTHWRITLYTTMQT